MKLRILLFFTFLGLGLNAQTSQPQPTGNTNTYYSYLGGYGFEKGLRLPNGTSSFLFPNVANKKGFIQYNTDLNLPQFYNGTTWITFGGQTATPTLQQVLTAGSEANITSPFIVNYKPGTPQAVEFSINDSNLQFGLPASNNYLIFDDAQLISTRSITVPDGTLDQHTVNVRQLNQAISGIQPPDVNLQTATDNGNSTTNDIILDAENANGNVSIRGAYGGVLDNSVITLQGDGSVKINTDENGQDLGSSVSIAGVRVSGKKISSSDGTYEAPINDYDFTQKKYIDDAIQVVITGVTLQEAYNNGQDIDANGGDFNVVNAGLIGFDADNIQIGSGTGTTNLGQQTITMPALPVNNTPGFYVGLSNTGQLFKSNSPTSTPTNLSYTASGTNGVVNNSNGTGFTIPAATGTNAGLLLPGDKNKLNVTSGTNTGDNVQATETTLGIASLANNSEALAGANDTKIITPLKLKSVADTKVPVPTTTGALFYNTTNNTTTAVTGNGGQVLRPNATTVNQNNLVFDVATLTTHNPAAGVIAAGDMLVTIINKIVGNINAILVINTTLTAQQSASTLNTAYPGAPVETFVVAPNVGTGMMYIKTTTGGQWMQVAGSLLNP